MSSSLQVKLAPRFRPGETVRIKMAQVYTHIRTPWYVMGKIGIVERVVAAFPDAEKTAYGDANAEHVLLYRITFGLAEIWGDPTIDHADTIDVEIYENWLVEV